MVRKKKSKRVAAPVSSGRKQPARAQEMMRVALDLFAERNFASVTIKDIASALGVNTALLYYYFDSKEDLFRATIETTVNEAFAHFRQLRLRHDHPAEVISDWLENHIDLFDPIHKLVKISLDYSGSEHRQASIDRSIRQFYDEESRLLSESIQQGIDTRIFRRVDPAQLAQFISGYLDGLMVRAVILPGFDLRSSVMHFRMTLWDLLGYKGRPGAARTVARKRKPAH